MPFYQNSVGKSITALLTRQSNIFQIGWIQSGGVGFGRGCTPADGLDIDREADQTEHGTGYHPSLRAMLHLPRSPTVLGLVRPDFGSIRSRSVFRGTVRSGLVCGKTDDEPGDDRIRNGGDNLRRAARTPDHIRSTTGSRKTQTSSPPPPPPPADSLAPYPQTSRLEGGSTLHSILNQVVASCNYEHIRATKKLTRFRKLTSPQ